MVAIIIVCLSAFRSFFIQHNSRNQSPPKRSWYVAAKASLSNKSSEKNDCELGPIPGATLTGMRTYIGGVGDESAQGINQAGNQEDDLWPLQQEAAASGQGQRIRVRHDLSTHWEPVSGLFPPQDDGNGAN